MNRIRMLVAGGATAICAAAGFFLGSGAADAVPLGPCDVTQAGNIWTLTANCDTTAPILIPDGITLNGANHTITAHDPDDPGFFTGGVLTSAGATMNVENLTIQGTGFASNRPPNPCDRGNLFGIWFNDAGGAVTDVTIDAITANTGCPPTTGTGIRADGVTVPRIVTITNTNVTNYQRNGLDARGLMTMNVSGGMVRPKDLTGTIGQNGIVYAATAHGQPGGTVSGATIFGVGDAVQPTGLGVAVVLQGAKNVTITKNTFASLTGAAGTDDGVYVWLASSGITISNNHIARSGPDTPNDPDGVGIIVCSSNSPPVVAVCGQTRTVLDSRAVPGPPFSSATTICNTFSGWNHNIVGAIQINCTPLPNGTQCHAYAPQTPTVEGGIAPYHWAVESGSLPPGLTLAAADGTITGTPTKVGTFKFTVKVTDSSDPLTATHDESITIEPDCATTPPPSSPPPSTSSTSPFVPGPGATGDSPRRAGLSLWALLAGAGAALVLGRVLLARRRLRPGRHS